MTGDTEAIEVPENSINDSDIPENSGIPEEAETAELVRLLYPELKRLARIHMRKEHRIDHTLQPTALVSEVFLKLAARSDVQWRDRTHFLRAASRAMRLLLIDHARRYNSDKHPGSSTRFDFNEMDISSDERTGEYIVVDQLLRKMADVDPRMAEMVELKVFGGLTFPEIGEVMGIHERTAKRDWQLARAWLFGHLRGSEQDDG